MTDEKGTNKCIYCVPYGGWIALPIMLELIGIVLFSVAAFSCKTFEATITYDETGFDETYKEGYWRWELDGDCEEFASEDIDSDVPLKVGRAFGILGAIIGYLLFFFLLTFTFVAYPRAYKHLLTMVAVICFFLALCSGILLVGLANDICDGDDDEFGLNVSCRPSGVGYCAVVATVFFIGAGVSTLVMNNKGVLKLSSFSQQSVTTDHQDEAQTPTTAQPNETVIETVENDDGTYTQTTIKTSVAPDGSKHIEKTVKKIKEMSNEPEKI